MGVSRPPLRAAFWAISAALLLMLLATLSDPYRVRQSMITQRTADRSHDGLLAEGTGREVQRRHDQQPDAASAHPPTRDAGTAEGSVPLAREVAVDAPHVDRRVETAPFAGGASMHVVSAAETEGPPRISRPLVRPAMPVLAPGELTGPTVGGRFEELPPPPELAQGPESFDNPPLPGDAAVRHEAERSLERLRLATELLTLRHDLKQSIESQQIEQIRHLQRQQGELLERQQQTAERLEQLARRLARQAARLDSVFAKETHVAPPTTTVKRIDAAPEDDAETSPPEQAARGRHRLSLVIESDDVAGIVDRLNRWSSATAWQPSVPAVTGSPAVEPQTRYLAPPPAHVDPTPLSDLDSSPSSVPPGQLMPQPGPLSGGPLFSPPSLCR